MTPKFARSVDRVFLCVLDLLERIEQNKPLNVNDERIRIQQNIDNAEAALGQVPEWELAKYGIVSWIDEMLIEAPWSGSDWWENNPLERKYFFDRNAYTQFYLKAKEAAALQDKNALEVFYICVVLGFRGFYSGSSSAQYAEQLGVAPRLEDWPRNIATTIQLGQGRPPLEDTPILGDGAPPLDGRSQVISMSFFAITLLAAAVGYYVFFVVGE